MDATVSSDDRDAVDFVVLEDTSTYVYDYLVGPVQEFLGVIFRWR